MPSEEILRACFEHNPDGAGYMFGPYDHAIWGRKGFMSLEALLRDMDEVNHGHFARWPEIYGASPFEKMAVVLHFRIGTSGGNTPENCHPFPLTGDARESGKLEWFSPRGGIAHNGVMPTIKPREGFSDTREFVATHLGPIADKRPNRAFWDYRSFGRELDEHSDGSRFALMDGCGHVHLVGRWHELGGIYYSNMLWMPTPKSSNHLLRGQVDNGAWSWGKWEGLRKEALPTAHKRSWLIDEATKAHLKGLARTS